MAIREIIFRGKKFDNGEWVIGDLIQLEKEAKYWYVLPFGVSAELYEIELYKFRENDVMCEVALAKVIPETVGQYTGLTDKNGKKIFKGDICKTYFESYTRSWEEVGVVTEFCGAYGIESADGKHFRAFINETVHIRSREVIGTIYDNPELLEVKE